MINASRVKKELMALSSRRKAKLLSGFFKTGKGEYGEGDVFLGVMVPEQRKIAGKYWDKLSLVETLKLLRSRFHEERLTALLILLEKYKKGDEGLRERIFREYLGSTRHINNWDLVDVTCRDIVGKHLFDRDRKILFDLARSGDLWERRIAIVSTAYFIGQGDLRDTFKIAKILLQDKHDLIRKAVGWMLREAGKKSIGQEMKFLDKYATQMPRTMLRYAIERFPERIRKKYLELRNKN